MEPELGLHRTVYHANGVAEHNLIKFLDHLALGKCAQITTLLSGRTLRMLLGQGGKISPGFNFFFEGFTFMLRANQDMTCGGFSQSLPFF